MGGLLVLPVALGKRQRESESEGGGGVGRRTATNADHLLPLPPVAVTLTWIIAVIIQ